MKGFRGILLVFPSLNIGIDVANSHFLGIPNCFPKLKPHVGILNERESRIPVLIQRTNQMERKIFTLSRIAQIWRSSSCLSAVATSGFLVLASR